VVTAPVEMVPRPEGAGEGNPRMPMAASLTMALLLAAEPIPAPAQPPPAPPAAPLAPWKATIGAGLIYVDGNAFGLTGTVAAAAERKSERWILGGRASAAYGVARSPGETDQKTSAYAASLQLRVDRRFTPRLSGYALSGVETDHVQSLETRRRAPSCRTPRCSSPLAWASPSATSSPPGSRSARTSSSCPACGVRSGTCSAASPRPASASWPPSGSASPSPPRSTAPRRQGEAPSTPASRSRWTMSSESSERMPPLSPASTPGGRIPRHAAELHGCGGFSHAPANRPHGNTSNLA